MTQVLETIPSEPTQTAYPVISSSTDILTLEEAANYLRLSPEVLRRSAEKFQVPGKLFEEEWRFSKAAIDRSLSTPVEAQIPIETQESIEVARSRLPNLLEIMKTWNNPAYIKEDTETWEQLQIALQNSTLRCRAE